PIPAFCQAQQSLTYLNLASNALSGPPTPLSSPSCSASLEILYLSSNRLSGPIPATISSFTLLKGLLLDKNMLTGAIPVAFSLPLGPVGISRWPLEVEPAVCPSPLITS
ncbi:unnamed protein product, partial [Closterium sp. Naga37s-1]